MAAPHGPDQGHSRHGSSDVRRVAMPRRSTKGPLDMDTQPPPSPSSAPTPTPILRTSSPQVSSLLSPTSVPRTRSPSPATVAPSMQLDLSPLLRPSLYAPIPTSQFAPPFLHPANQPPPDTPLATLLSHKRFLHAAAKAADNLTSGTISPTEQPQQILDLFYTRLSCLLLCNQPSLASKEAKLLSDILTRETNTFPRPHREIHLSRIPWSLRLLLLKLSVFNTPDAHRRFIMGLYGLSSECRILANKARVEGDKVQYAVWRDRLSDLGVRVAAELVEANEFDAARRHLDMLSASSSSSSTTSTTAQMTPQQLSTLIRKTLLLVKIGDIEAARKGLKTCTFTPADNNDDHGNDNDNNNNNTDLIIQLKVLEATTLLLLSPSPSSSLSTPTTDSTTQATTRGKALQTLQSLQKLYPASSLIQHNLAITHLYNDNADDDKNDNDNDDNNNDHNNDNNITLCTKMLESLLLFHTNNSSNNNKANNNNEKPAVIFPTLLTNLATCYELKGDRAREKKEQLVDWVVHVGTSASASASFDHGRGKDEVEGASGSGSGIVGGFEREMGEFKL